MNDWICPIEAIDADIREVVRIAYENDMRPYMSCSGSVKDHEGKGAIPIAGSVETLDSEYIREIIAILIDDPRYACSIRKQGATRFYDNILPEGLNFQLEFENACGDVQTDLSQLFTDVINGRRALPQQRKNIDFICDLVSQFDVRSGSKICFTFNDPKVLAGKENLGNYAITVTGPKNIESITSQIEGLVEDIEQENRTCKIYGSDSVAMTGILKKVVEEYPRVPSLRPGERLKVGKSTTPRVDLFFERYNEGKTVLKERELNSDLFTEENYFSISPEDLLDFFDL